MKKIVTIVSAAALGLSLAACESQAENTAEDYVEGMEDATEATIDGMEQAGEITSEQADAMQENVEEKADAAQDALNDANPETIEEAKAAVEGAVN